MPKKRRPNSKEAIDQLQRFRILHALSKLETQIDQAVGEVPPELLQARATARTPIEPSYFAAVLRAATWDEIRSEYARRLNRRRRTKSGGGTWKLHHPDAGRGCRCGMCKQWREADAAAKAAANPVVIV